jgi:hypothetical protein
MLRKWLGRKSLSKSNPQLQKSKTGTDILAAMERLSLDGCSTHQYTQPNAVYASLRTLLLKQDNEGAIEYINTHLSPDSADFIANLCHRTNNEVIALFLLRNETYQDALSDHYLNMLLVKFNASVFDGAKDNPDFAWLLIISLPGLARLTPERITQLAIWYPNWTNDLLLTIFDTEMQQHHSDSAWLRNTIDWVYYSSDTAKTIFHYVIAYLEKALAINSTVITAERLSSLFHIDCLVALSVLSSPSIMQKLNLDTSMPYSHQLFCGYDYKILATRYRFLGDEYHDLSEKYARIATTHTELQSLAPTFPTIDSFPTIHAFPTLHFIYDSKRIEYSSDLAHPARTNESDRNFDSPRLMQ